MRTTIVVTILAILAATPAFAEDDQKKAEAEKYFRAGESLYKNGQYLGAAQAFEEAFELLPLPAIAFSTAQAYRLLYVSDPQPAYVKRAVELYHQYIDMVKQGQRVPDATASVAELQPTLDRLEKEGKSLAMPVVEKKTQLDFTSQIDGARGEVNGTKGPLPLIVEVKPGDYTAHVEADGYFPADVKATAVDGQFIVTEVDLQAKPAIVDVKAEKGSRVEVDGRPAGTTPLVRPLEVPAGAHFVSITHRGRVAWSENIDAHRGETVKLDVDLRKTGQRAAVPFVWMGAGVLALAAGGAGAYALVEQGKASDLNDQRLSGQITAGDLDDYLRYRSNRDTGVTTMWAFAGASVVTATVGTLMYLFDRPMAEAPPLTLPTAGDTTVSPFATQGGAGVSLGGSW